MAKGNIKSVKSKYKYVQGLTSITTKDIKWFIHIKGVGRNGYENERDCALAVDKYLISKGKEPVNILKKRNG